MFQPPLKIYFAKNFGELMMCTLQKWLDQLTLEADFLLTLAKKKGNFGCFKFNVYIKLFTPSILYFRVTIRIGSASNFTEELLRLENEAAQIRSRNPCPKKFKASSAEYLFREKKLFVDWCRFMLLPSAL